MAETSEQVSWKLPIVPVSKWRPCSVCGKVSPEEKFKRCSQCCAVVYCSVDCQRKDWNDYEHKYVCRNEAGPSWERARNTLAILEAAKEAGDQDDITRLTGAHMAACWHLMDVIRKIANRTEPLGLWDKYGLDLLAKLCFRNYRLCPVGLSMPQATNNLCVSLMAGCYQGAYDALRFEFRRRTTYMAVLDRVEATGLVNEPHEHIIEPFPVEVFEQDRDMNSQVIGMNPGVSSLDILDSTEGFCEGTDITESLEVCRLNETSEVAPLLMLARIKFQLYQFRRNLDLIENGYLGNRDLVALVAQFIMEESVANRVMQVESAPFLLRQSREVLSMIHAQNKEFFQIFNMPDFFIEVQRTTGYKSELLRACVPLQTPVRPTERVNEMLVYEMAHAYVMCWGEDAFAFGFLEHFGLNVDDEVVPVPTTSGDPAPLVSYRRKLAALDRAEQHPGEAQSSWIAHYKENRVLIAEKFPDIYDEGTAILCATSILTRLKIQGRVEEETLSLFFGNRESLEKGLLEDRQKVALYLANVKFHRDGICLLSDLGIEDVAFAPVKVPSSLAEGHSPSVKRFIERVFREEHAINHYEDKVTEFLTSVLGPPSRWLDLLFDCKTRLVTDTDHHFVVCDVHNIRPLALDDRDI